MTESFFLPSPYFKALENARSWVSAVDWKQQESEVLELLSRIRQKLTKLQMWQSHGEALGAPQGPPKRRCSSCRCSSPSECEEAAEAAEAEAEEAAAAEEGAPEEPDSQTPAALEDSQSHLHNMYSDPEASQCSR